MVDVGCKMRDVGIKTKIFQDSNRVDTGILC
jgi:hypothetical protein